MHEIIWIDQHENYKLYEFLQFHFHTPSEHSVNGHHYDSEIHFVHNISNTEYLVIGIFLDVKQGKEEEDEFLDEIKVCEEEVEKDIVIDSLSIRDFFEKIH